LIDFTDIENRYIPFRAFGFGPANAKTDDDLSRDVEFGGIEQNHLQLGSVRFWDKLNPNKRFRLDQKSLIDEFSNKIAEESFNILKTLKLISARSITEVASLFRTFHFDSIDSTEPKIERLKEQTIEKIVDNLIIDIPDYRRVQLKYETLNFEEASYQTVRWTIPIDQIARYYQLHRILGYVYTNYNFCSLIFLATERVAYKFLHSIKLVFDQSQVLPKEIFKTGEKIKKFIVANDPTFYKEYEDILPLNEDLLTVSAKRKINDVLHNLNRLMYFDGKRLTYLDVENFLKQFPKKIQLTALNLINSIKVLPNDELVSEIKELIKEYNPTDEKDIVGILPLGSYMSSSSNMMKSYRQFLDYHNIAQLSFTQRDQIIKCSHIFLVDDNINTGRQAVNLVAKMLGTPIEKLKEKELFLEAIHKQDGEGEKINQSDVINHLKAIKLTFIFITGYEDSDSALKNYLIDCCGLNEKNITIRIKHKLLENDKFFSGGSSKDDSKKATSIFRQIKDDFKENPTNITDLKIFLEKIGRDVVKSRSIIKSNNQDPSSHCLGYCNRESLVVFPSSVPTMTITALWCDGHYEYEGEQKEWKSIMPRPVKK